jgi:hypothetical protein
MQPGSVGSPPPSLRLSVPCAATDRESERVLATLTDAISARIATEASRVNRRLGVLRGVFRGVFMPRGIGTYVASS